MSFLLRGRSPWFGHDQSHPRAAEPAPEPVPAATGLPVAAPAPEGVTDDLSALCVRLANPISAQLRGRGDLHPRLSEKLAHAVLPVVLATLAKREQEVREEIREQLQHILDTEDFSDDHLGVQRVIELLEER